MGWWGNWMLEVGLEIILIIFFNKDNENLVQSGDIQDVKEGINRKLL